MQKNITTHSSRELKGAIDKVFESKRICLNVGCISESKVTHDERSVPSCLNGQSRVSNLLYKYPAFEPVFGS